MQAYDPEAMRIASDAAFEYLDQLPSRRVIPDAAAVAETDAYDPPLPEDASEPAEVVAELVELGRGATVATAGPRYFGYVVGGVAPAALGANWLAGAWDQVATDYRLSPLAVRLEEVAGRWLLDLLRLPRECSVNFSTGSTMGAFIGLAAARACLLHRMGWDVQSRGLTGAPALRVVTGQEAHSTMFKALGMLGLGTATAIRVPVDDQGRLKADAMPELGPDCIVIAQAGNVNSGAFDPIGEMCDKARTAGAWVHVDGAFGLLAAASPNYAHLLEGHDLADSWNIDGHKWLNTPYDCGIAMCRHPQEVRRAFAISANYLGDNQRDPRTLVPELSRRARSIEVWAVLRSLGRQGIADLVDRNCAQARRFAEGLEARGFAILNDVVLNQCVAAFGTDERMQAIARHVQDSGKAWFSTTHWQGRTALRFNCTSWLTRMEDVEITLAAIDEAVAVTG